MHTLFFAKVIFLFELFFDTAIYFFLIKLSKINKEVCFTENKLYSYQAVIVYFKTVVYSIQINVVVLFFFNFNDQLITFLI